MLYLNFFFFYCNGFHTMDIRCADNNAEAPMGRRFSLPCCYLEVRCCRFLRLGRFRGIAASRSSRWVAGPVGFASSQDSTSCFFAPRWSLICHKFTRSTNSHALQTHTLYKANAPPAIVSIHGITPAYFHCLHATLARRAQARAALRPRVLGTGQLHFLCNLESPVRT